MFIDFAELRALNRQVMMMKDWLKQVVKFLRYTDQQILTHPAPHDVDIAVFQDSDEEYLPLAMKYRRLARPVAREIPLDIIPVRMDAGNGTFRDEIDKGESIYER